MQLRVITLSWDASKNSFDETALREATSASDVLGYETRWTTVDGRECLVLVLRLTGGPGGGEAPARAGSSWKPGERRSDPRREEAMRIIREMEDQMPTETKDAFYKLKEWRGDKVKGTSAPAYSVATNIQLAMLAFKAPKTIAEIKQIKGLGAGFCRNYGAEVLEMLKALAPAPFTPPGSAESAAPAESAADEDDAEKEKTNEE